jgi:succinate dehydrogenase/fumarate reductase flavoprotein subunit
MQPYNVIVIGKGNAMPCAALAAGGRGVTVAMMKAATPDESGSRLAGGVMRLAYDNAEAPRKPITDVERRNTDRESQTRAPFFDDLYRVATFGTDPRLSEITLRGRASSPARCSSASPATVPRSRSADRSARDLMRHPEPGDPRASGSTPRRLPWRHTREPVPVEVASAA